MTKRAIIIGCILAMLVAVGGHFNDVFMGQTYMVGNFFPISVIGFLVVLVLVISPLLYWIRPRLSLSARELVVIVALPLAVCVVPGSGFLRTFTSVMVLPRHYEQLSPSWQKNEVLSYIPEKLLAAPAGDAAGDAIGKFLQGMGTIDRHIGLSDIPWAQWQAPLLIWLPLFFTLMLALIGLSLVLHRQWSAHEHLVYPVAEFIGLLTQKSKNKAYPAVLTERLFWFGLAPVLAIHLVNGLHVWHPGFISIPMELDLGPLKELLPRLAANSQSWGFFLLRIYFSVVAFSFFLPSDITLSLGLSNIAAVLFSTALVTYGIPISDNLMGDGEIQGLMFGAYLGMFILILFSGRAYYSRVLLAALGKKGPVSSAPEQSAVWGCRLFLLAGAASILMMTRMGLEWPYAALVALILVMLFTAMSRICVETGLFFIQPGWQPVGILIGLCGAAAIGPQVLAVSALICLVVCIDPREAMMPFFVNAQRAAENTGLKRGRLAVTMTFMLAAGLLAGLLMVLWLQYDKGAGLNDVWATFTVPKMGFDLVDAQIQKIQAEGVLGEIVGVTWIQRLRFFSPNKGFTAFLAIGFALFSVCALLRLRFSKWPFHPVLFLVWFTFPSRCFAWSFFIGWAVKSLIVKFGGGSAYQRLKPLMIGLIAGDLLGGLIFMAGGAVYYFITGFPPKTFSIFPG